MLPVPPVAPGAVPPVAPEVAVGDVAPGVGATDVGAALLDVELPLVPLDVPEVALVSPSGCELSLAQPKLAPLTPTINASHVWVGWFLCLIDSYLSALDWGRSN